MSKNMFAGSSRLRAAYSQSSQRRETTGLKNSSIVTHVYLSTRAASQSAAELDGAAGGRPLANTERLIMVTVMRVKSLYIKNMQ